MNQKDVNQLLAQPEPEPQPEPQPEPEPQPPPPPSERDHLRARIAEMEGEADRLVMGMVRLWSKLSKLRKEV